MYKGYIYKWENKINNKVYIGQTMNRYGYRERWSQHRYQAENSIHNNNKFHNAIRKYGIKKRNIGSLMYRLHDKIYSSLNDIY